MSLEITTASFIFPIVAYAAGFLSGYVARDYTKDKIIETGGLVLVVVTFVWAVSMFIDIATPEYTTSPLVHGLMGAIVGFFYKPGKSNEKKNK